MFNIEKKVLNWLEQNLVQIVIVIGTICSILVRYLFRDITSGDYKAFLEGWYEQIYSGGV